MNNESSSKFISALVKALQTLCHGYIEFNDGIEIIGHIYLNVDSGSSFDYVVKEKLCKNTENSTVFVSKSFQAQAPLDECLTRKDKNDHTTVFEEAPDMSPTTGTSRIASAITSISNVLSGTQDGQKVRLLDPSSHHSAPQNTGKRKREHNGSYNNLQPPVKYTTLQASSSSSSPYFSSEPSSKLPTDRNNSEHFTASSHGEFFGADSNQSSGMGADEEDDLHLDVTFVKEEYQRNSSHRGAPASAASRLSQELSSNHSNMLHDGTSGVGALGFSSNHHQGSHFASGTAGDIANMNDNFHDTSQVEIGHNAAQGPPNPRSEMDDGASHAFQVPAVPMKYFRCPVCSILIQHKNNILRHMRQHNDPAAIGNVDVKKVWSQHFVVGSRLQEGRQTRSHNCPICGLLISHRKNVRRHMRKHTGEMFYCDLCDWRGTCRWKMQKHREKKHGVIIPAVVTSCS